MSVDEEGRIVYRARFSFTSEEVYQKT